ncbi:DUF4054 domain-containing protein [Listeria monocytogenes]|uniref:DUF4054 domain-containing protein n=1 Tax=Listeria monocytogenes TaxID=1639 RepID=UPI001645E066|nr:DUF4054 domain-containing protein [Listeria monocytogenes]MBC3581237.1 DUF4054 domain-containing protein [Listeria monocytogenes]
MKTDVDRLKLTASAIANVSDATLQLHIDDAYSEVQEKGFPENLEERANRYLAAHLATLANKDVKSEAVGSLKREYYEVKGDTGLLSTEYGQEYARLLKEANGGSGLNLVVV